MKKSQEPQLTFFIAQNIARHIKIQNGITKVLNLNVVIFCLCFFVKTFFIYKLDIYERRTIYITLSRERTNYKQIIQIDNIIVFFQRNLRIPGKTFPSQAFWAGEETKIMIQAF